MRISLFNKVLTGLVTLLVVGCAKEPMPLGQSVALIKQEQIYNPNASLENKDVIPEGSGERMQATLDLYHKETASDENKTINTQTVLAIPLSK